MAFFIILIILVTNISLLIIFTEIKIHIKNLNLKAENKEIYLNKDYKVIIKFCIFNKINYFKISIDKTKINSQKAKKSLNKIERKIIKDRKIKNIKFKSIFKILKLKKLNFKLEIGTENAALTAICIGVISTFLSMLVGNLAYSIKDINWKIDPVYNYGNLLNLEFNCIFSLKLIHIINTIYEIRKEGDKYARTSNRKDSEHVYE